MVVVVPTLEAACGDNPELSVVGADGFDEVLCEPKSLPPFAPPPPPLVPEEPPELPATVLEHLRHLGNQEWRRWWWWPSFGEMKFISLEAPVTDVKRVLEPFST